jgi:hypothetical protein
MLMVEGKDEAAKEIAKKNNVTRETPSIVWIQNSWA